jgi:hypothetical protein
MRDAISDCHAIDDCRGIADQAAAIAAYFKQLKDDESYRKFLEVKLRAWRRIGELFRQIDVSDCDTLVAQYRKIRAAFAGVEAATTMSDTVMREALRVAALPSDFFEEHAGDYHSTYSIAAAHERLQRELWEASPAGQREKEALAKRNARWEAEDAEKKEQAQNAQKEKRQAELELAQTEIEHHRIIQTLKVARDEAMSEVGLTLDRRDRERMREVVFLIKDTVHEALRRAAFDQRITMQAVLRAGLAMWFIAHAYDVPMSDFDLRPKGTKK